MFLSKSISSDKNTENPFNFEVKPTNNKTVFSVFSVSQIFERYSNKVNIFYLNLLFNFLSGARILASNKFDFS